MKTFYVAASAARQQDAREIAAGLRVRGAKVKARWLEQPDVSYDRVGVEDELPHCAQYDMHDVICCDEVVCLSGDAYTKGGRHAEVGAAIALGKRVWLIGPREHVFHYHPLVTVVEGVDLTVMESGLIRKTVRVGVVDQTLHDLRNWVWSAPQIYKRGHGKLLSGAEYLGTLTMAMGDLETAIKSNNASSIQARLFDLAVAATWSLASMRTQG